MTAPTSRKSSSSKPRIVAAGVPIRPRSDRRRALVERHRVAVDGQLHLGETLLGVLARPVRPAQVELEQVRVRPAGEHVEPALLERLGERVGVRAHLALVVAERLGRRDLKAGRLGRDRVHERAALHAGEDSAVDRLRVLLLAEDEAGARAGERLVRRRGDEVAVRHRARMQPGGDEPGEVGHVAESSAPTSSAISRNSVGLDGARIGRAAADDQARPVHSFASRAPRRSRPRSSRARLRSARSCRAGREKLTLSPCVRWPPCAS